MFYLKGSNYFESFFAIFLINQKGLAHFLGSSIPVLEQIIERHDTGYISYPKKYYIINSIIIRV